MKRSKREAKRNEDFQSKNGKSSTSTTKEREPASSSSLLTSSLSKKKKRRNALALPRRRRGREPREAALSIREWSNCSSWKQQEQQQQQQQQQQQRDDRFWAPEAAVGLSLSCSFFSFSFLSFVDLFCPPGSPSLYLLLSLSLPRIIRVPRSKRNQGFETI